MRQNKEKVSCCYRSYLTATFVHECYPSTILPKKLQSPGSRSLLLLSVNFLSLLIKVLLWNSGWTPSGDLSASASLVVWSQVGTFCPCSSPVLRWFCITSTCNLIPPQFLKCSHGPPGSHEHHKQLSIASPAWIPVQITCSLVFQPLPYSSLPVQVAKLHCGLGGHSTVMALPGEISSHLVPVDI